MLNSCKNKNKAKWILLFAAAVLLLAVITVFVMFPHYLFIAGEYLGIRGNKMQLNPIEPDETVELTLDEITECGDITFDQSLMLVNTEYPLPDDFIPDVSEYKDTGVYMNSCMPEAYQKLSSAVYEKLKKSSISPAISARQKNKRRFSRLMEMWQRIPAAVSMKQDWHWMCTYRILQDSASSSLMRADLSTQSAGNMALSSGIRPLENRRQRFHMNHGISAM